MTENYLPASTPPQQAESPPPVLAEEQGTAEVVKDQAADLSHSGIQAGKHAADVAREQASGVAAEAGSQGKDLLRQAQDQLTEQAARGQQQLAAELLSLSDELSSMADGSSQGGVAADLARHVASRARDAGQWLGDRRPAQVMDEVQSFARRRPGVFVALAAAAGLAASGSPAESRAPPLTTPRRRRPMLCVSSAGSGHSPLERLLTRRERSASPMMFLPRLAAWGRPAVLRPGTPVRLSVTRPFSLAAKLTAGTCRD